jgi:hypothetical protein
MAHKDTPYTIQDLMRDYLDNEHPLMIDTSRLREQTRVTTTRADRKTA